MKVQYGFYVDTARCINCYACEIACKSWKGIKAGTVSLRKVHDVTRGTFPNVTRTYISLSCMHCGDAPCEKACPTGAITKREDGIVVVDQEKCIGCHSCFFACPFGIPQFNEDGKMEKCDMCLDRLAEGKDPACVATCPTQALHFGTMEELGELARGKSATRFVAANDPSLLVSQ